MAKYNILKALEFDKLSAATKRLYVNVQGLADAGWWAQPKYDGVFGKATVFAAGGGTMESRTGEPITSCDHILTALFEQAQAQSGGWDDFVVLGELWHETLPFPTISGDVRRHKASPHLLFVMNDMLPLEMESTLPYFIRHENLSDFEKARATDALRLAPAPVPCRKGVVAMAEALVKQGGYDGLILRDPDAAYTIGDAKQGQIVKVKPKLTLDLLVKRMNRATGAKTGRNVYTIDVEYRGVVTTVGAGMPHSASESPGAGVIVEIECLGITADGALREPVYKGIRFDKLEPDA